MPKNILSDFTILYVEDCIDTQELVGSILEPFFQEVYLANNGKEGLALFKSKRPNIILSDIHMPLMNGIEMSEAILKENQHQQIALFTAFNELLYLRQAVNLGISKYILKPFDEKQFFDSLLDMAKVLQFEAKELLLQQEVKQQLENFKTLGNNIPDVILRIDNKKNVLFINKKACDFFKVQADDVKNFKLCDSPILKEQQADNIRIILNDLDKLSSPITHSLNHKVNNSNKNYFIRIIPEQTKDALKTFLVVLEDITERIESEDMFNQLFYHASDAIVLSDHKSGKVMSINSKARKLLEFNSQKLDEYSASDILESFETEALFHKHIDALDKCGHDSYEATRTISDKSTQYLKIYCTLIDIGDETYHQSIIHDLTEHKLLELQLQQTSRVFEHTAEGIVITKLDGSIVSANDAFLKITGYRSEEVIGKNPSFLQSGRHDKAFYKKMWDSILDNGLFKGEIWNKKKDGTIYPEWLAISAIYDENNKPIQYVAVFSDFTEIKKNQTKLENLAHYDQLTKLPNRLLLHEQIKQSIKVAKRTKSQFATLFIDLDRFKQINDTHGHNIGDEVLKITAKRLKDVLREADIVARLGGDEFIVVVNEMQHIQNVHIVAQSIIDKLQLPFKLEEYEHYISASIGISIYPDDATNDDSDSLIKNADIAMYESKAIGKNCYSFFSSSMAESVKALSTLHNDLSVALSKEEFYLVYQPQYNVVTEEILGFEALLRWKHETKGEIYPDEFIPYTEESKLIIPIGRWVIEQAIRDYKVISQVLKTNFTIAVNVSHVQLNQNFIDILQHLILEERNLAKFIKIEITETSAMNNLEQTQKIIGRIKELGFKISLDDFGTGYSALNAIKTLRVDEIKIDRSFIKDVPGDKDDEELVSTIIAMAKVMNKSVVAEGVEETQTRDFLVEKECPIIQGYLISKPMTLEKTLEFIQG